MSTIARIEANQQNARLSTGPATEEGKQKSSLNAVKHGILARILPHENQEYQELLTGLYHTFRPANEFQRILVDQIAVATIRLRRIYQAELELVEKPRLFRKTSTQYKQDGSTEVMEEQEPAPIGVFLRSDTTRNMIRYESMCQRQIQRNVDLLSHLSTNWKFRRFHNQSCPYLEPAAEPESEPAPSDSADTSDSQISTAEVIARCRKERLRESAELDALLGKKWKNRAAKAEPAGGGHPPAKLGSFRKNDKLPNNTA